MLGQYLPLLALFALAALFAAGSFVASGLLAPRRPTVPKLDPYECGIVPSRDAPERFPVRFFLVAMIFIVFDVEIILLYPYVVANGGLGVFGLVAVLVFTFAVFESFVYLIGAGALEWGPASRYGRLPNATLASAPPADLAVSTPTGVPAGPATVAVPDAVTDTTAVPVSDAVSHTAALPVVPRAADAVAAPEETEKAAWSEDAEPVVVSAGRGRGVQTTVRQVGLEGRWPNEVN